MKNRIFVGIFLSVCVLFVPVVAQQVTDAQKAEIEKILTEAINEINNSASQLNTEGFAKHLSEDFQRRVGGGNVGPIGKAEYLKWLGNLFSQRESQEFTRDFFEIYVISSDLAYTIQAGGGPVVFKTGRHAGFANAITTIWKKESAGWKIIHSHESWW